MGPVGQDKSSQQVLELAPSAPERRSGPLGLAGEKKKYCSSSLRPASRSVPLCHHRQKKGQTPAVSSYKFTDQERHLRAYGKQTHTHTHTFYKHKCWQRQRGQMGRQAESREEGGFKLTVSRRTSSGGCLLNVCT